MLQNHSIPALRRTPWAMTVLGYTSARRSAFWQFVHSNHVPHIRVGPKTIMFSEPVVADWLARRSINGRNIV